MMIASRKAIRLWILASCLWLGILGVARAQDSDSGRGKRGSISPTDHSDLLTRLAVYEEGQSSEALAQVEDLIRKAGGDSAAQRDLAAGLGALLGGEATRDAKAFVCRELAIIGGKDEVPALAALLGQDVLSDYARYALEQISDASAREALRDSLSRLFGQKKAGVINTLGARRESESAGDLADFLKDFDPAVAAAAASALGKIGGAEAVRALGRELFAGPDSNRGAIVDALLNAADQDMAHGRNASATIIYSKVMSAEAGRSKASKYTPSQIAALRGLVLVEPDKALDRAVAMLSDDDSQVRMAAMGFVRDIPGENITTVFASILGDLSPEGKIQLLGALADRGDPAALPAVVGQIEDGDEEVRAAAYSAMGKIGGAKSALVLAEAAAEGGPAERIAARDSLKRLSAPGIDAAITDKLAEVAPAVRVELIRALGDRNAVVCVPNLLIAMGDRDEDVRLAALRALGKLAGERDLRTVIERLRETDSGSERAEIEKTILGICRHISRGQDGPGPSRGLDVLEKALPHISSGKTRGQLQNEIALIKSRSAASGKKSAKASEAKKQDVPYYGAGDPFMGDWIGEATFADGRKGPSAGQVIALGEGKYRAKLFPEFDVPLEHGILMDGVKRGGKVVFEGQGDGGAPWTAEIEGKTFRGEIRGAYNATFEMKPHRRRSPTLGQEPPEGAIALFNGDDTDQWVHPETKKGPAGPCRWILNEDGSMQVKGGSIISKRKFKDVKVHLEFRTPFMPAKKGQGRGNSGVYLQGLYEVQILDSFGLDGLDNECGGIYKIGAPRVNMCYPPEQWQTYDIVFHASRLDDSGEKTENARITVDHNGVRIHLDQEIPSGTTAAAKSDHSKPEGLYLQDHGNPVQYRNIWVLELD